MSGKTGAALLLPVFALAACTPTLAHFETRLSAQDSATAALQDWCATQRIATPAVIRAEVDRTAYEAPSPATRAALGVAADAPVGFRHVRLACGAVVLSDARNWYVPAQLTADMNRTLETGDTPFGKVIAPLSFRRERLEQRRGRAAGCPRGTVLSHRARLRGANGTVLSLVIECYTRSVLTVRDHP